MRAANHLADGEVASLSVESWRDKALSNLYRLEATYTPDVPLPISFILKVGRSDETSVIARSRRWKEHEFYTRVAPIMADPPMPRPFASFDPATTRSHLLLEDLSPTHQSPPALLPPAPEQLRGAIACLAQIHS